MNVENKVIDIKTLDTLAAQSPMSLGMKRETHYDIVAVHPITVETLHEKLREFMPKNWKRKAKQLADRVILRDGVPVISVKDVLDSLRKIPEGFEQAITVVKWVDAFDNLVTTAGLNDSLTQHFKGSAYTAAWYVGLSAGTPTFASGDTMSSHAGWTENVTYSESVRQTLTLGSVSSGSVDNSASKAVFTINGTTTVGGAFLVTNSTKSGTSGTLYGGGAFGGGNRSLQSGDTLSITMTLTAS